MTPKVSITAYCITQTSLQSACFNSLLWVGVTSTSTLMILGTEHLLEGSFAQASPIASPDHFSNQPVIELVSSELSNANQQDFVWAVDSDLEIVSIANQTLQSPESVVPSNVILGVSLLDETDRESSESVFCQIQI
ncbi:MAG: hypothetical protein HC769_09535 [Cyanobacteria bacterium CRU_2_1]|nr:hypothetical protein [Cyanobacteria bacterium CRU_2_1]